MRRRRWRHVSRVQVAPGRAAPARIEASFPAQLQRAVETFGQRFLAIAFEACAPPVSNAVRVKLRGTRGEVGIEVLATERGSYSRLVMAPLTGLLLADLSMWAWAFASSYRIERNRRGQVRIRVSVVIDPDELATEHLRWHQGWGWTRDPVAAAGGA
jgi:hypothetical protein